MSRDFDRERRSGEKSQKPPKSYEARFYAGLLHKQVVAKLKTGSTLSAKLVWFCRYSVGLEDDAGKEFLLQKSDLSTLRLAD